ncbi:MAG: hypothetical protein ABSH16_00110 [Sedimentisphaerales bacterium]
MQVSTETDLEAWDAAMALLYPDGRYNHGNRNIQPPAQGDYEKDQRTAGEFDRAAFRSRVSRTLAERENRIHGFGNQGEHNGTPLL